MTSTSIIYPYPTILHIHSRLDRKNENGDYPAGTYIHMPKGSAHVPQSKTGCTVFVFYPEGRPL
jgi:hypothetical protein